MVTISMQNWIVSVPSSCYLHTTSLEKFLTDEMDILRIQSPNDDEWLFLKSLAVPLEPNLELFLHQLRKQKKQFLWQIMWALSTVYIGNRYTSVGKNRRIQGYLSTYPLRLALVLSSRSLKLRFETRICSLQKAKVVVWDGSHAIMCCESVQHLPSLPLNLSNPNRCIFIGLARISTSGLG